MGDEPKLLRVMELTEKQDLPAGEFSLWLRRTRRALTTHSGVDVPCAGCNACCRSSYFIHIGPAETETLARIPPELLFPAPGQPEGSVVMGYDEQGHCPMLVDGACSIYEHRPLTCRSYDCRIFAAAGIAAGEDDKKLVTRRSLRWKFDYPSERDRIQHSAVQAAARFLPEHAQRLGDEAPSTSSQLAILAIKVYDVFLKIHDGYNTNGSIPPDPDVVDAVMGANEEFDD